MGGAIDRTGQKFGKLTMLMRSGTSKHGKALWLAQCDCGNQKVVEAEKCKRVEDPIRSCGCIYKHRDEMATANQVYIRLYDDGDIIFEDFIRLSQEKCHYCGKAPSTTRVARNKKNSFTYNGLDRLTSTRAHFLDNVVTCCQGCNVRKSNTEYADFIKWIRTVYENTKDIQL